MPRIDDRYLKANNKPGDKITSEHMNEVESVVKAGINANYDDIQNLKNSVSDVFVNGESVVEVIDEQVIANIDLTNYVSDEDYVHTDNNYTNQEKSKLESIENGAEVNTVTGVKGDSESTYRTGDINITKSNIGLGNVENKSSSTIREELTNSDVTTALGYTPYNSTNPNGYTSNTGTITGITMNGSSKGTSGVVDLGTVITEHQDISGKQDTLVSGTNIKTINNQSLLGSGNINVSGGGDATDVRINDNSITSGGVANIVTNSAYDAVNNKIATMNDISVGVETDPIFSSSVAAGITSTDIINWDNKSTFSGNYNDLTNKPTIPTKTSDLTNDSGFIDSSYHDSTKQDTLVSGTNIKTINNTSLVGSGNIDLEGITTLTSPIRIWDLDDGVYKIPESCVIYPKGSTNTTSFTTRSSGVLFITHYSTTYKQWFMLMSNTGSSTIRELVNGYVSSSSGSFADFNLGDSYLKTNEVTDNLNTSSVDGKALAAHQGYVLNTNKQDTLVSGTNIKTINNESILGSGNITVGGGGSSTDVQVNGTSITSGGVANIAVNGTYDSSTNKIATMSDLPSDTGWVDLTPSGSVDTPGLASKGKIQYRKIGKLVELRGSVTDISSANTVIAVIPSAIRPSTRKDAIVSMSGSRWASIFVSDTGNLTMELNSAGTYTSTWWYGIDMMYYID